jgi:CubicO group peptidase (beta-lactamase class C family)/membrane protein YqaA with SNARE-associated domain
MIVAVSAPYFLSSHPVAVEIFGGTTLSMITTGALAGVGKSSLWIAILAPVGAVVRFSPFYWWAGRRYGHFFIEGLSSRSPAARRRVERAERVFRRFGPVTVVFAYFLPIPNGVTFAIAGWSGMNFWRFLVYDIIDALLYATVMSTLGYELGARALHIAHVISNDATTIALGLVVLFVVSVLFRRFRVSRGSASGSVEVDGAVPGGAFMPRTSFDFGGDSSMNAADRVEAFDSIGNLSHELPYRPTVVLVLVTPDGHRTRVWEGASQEGRRRGGPLYEIGSLSKVLTGTLLAEMTLAGELELNDYWSENLGKTCLERLPRVPVSLSELATHTGGMPVMSLRELLSSVGDPTQPYTGLTEEDLFAIGVRHSGRSAAFRYSNLGYALLGLVLSSVDGLPFQDLLRTRVLEPLGMLNTFAVSDSRYVNRRVYGGRLGRSTGPWRPGVFEPSFGMMCSVDDLVCFLEASLYGDTSEIGEAVALTQRTRVITGDSQLGIGLGWQIHTSGRGHVVKHPIRGPGSCGIVSLDPGAGIGLLALANVCDSEIQRQLEILAAEMLQS